MGLKNCSECGRLFLDNPAHLCLDCVRLQEKDSDTVAEYLWDKKGAKIEEIHEATGVKHKVILKMLRNGRIFGDTTVLYPCEFCAELITDGRACYACSKNILGQIKPKVKAKTQPSAGKVRDAVYTKF